MPIYRPDYSPRVNPYGGLSDITPSGMEALFLSSKGGNPNQAPLNYNVKPSGPYRLYVFWGKPTSPKTLYLYVSDDAGETWAALQHDFPSNHIMEEGIVESEYAADTLYFATRTFTAGGDFPSVETYQSPDKGNTWSHLYSFDIPGYDINRHRIFPTSKGVYQVADIVSLTGPPFETRILGWKDGVKVLDELTDPQIGNGGIVASHFVSKQETAFFALEFNTFLGGQEIWKVTSTNGIEKRGKVPESPLTIPPTNTRPGLQQLWYLPRKGVLYVPTLIQTGARLYTSFDEGMTFSEESGGVRIGIPELSTLGRRGIVDSPVTGDRFRNEGYMQDLADSTPFDDILDEFSDSTVWHLGLQRRLTRRQSRFYLWDMPNP